MSAATPAPAARGAAERLDALEVKLAFLDDLLESLNHTVYRQQQQIEQLVQAVAALRQQLRASPEGERGDARDEIPPHY